jgi:hypothetical protein
MTQAPTSAAVLLLLVALVPAGCEREESRRTGDELERGARDAGAQIEQAVEEGAARAREGAARAEEAIRDATDDVRDRSDRDTVRDTVHAPQRRP